MRLTNKLDVWVEEKRDVKKVSQGFWLEWLGERYCHLVRLKRVDFLKGLYFGHVKSEIPIRHLSGDI